MKEGMTKEEFIAEYCRHRDTLVEDALKYRVALPCACDEYKYVHWAMVLKNGRCIESHMLYYSPEAQK